VTAVDLPPVIGLVGTSRAAFRARPGGRRLAIIATIVTAIAWAIAWWLLFKQPREWRRPGMVTYAVLPIAMFLFAGVGLAVRTARIWIDGGGVRWGWRGLHVRMEVERLDAAEIYTDGVALAAKKGSRWFLAARDWDRFEVLAREIERAGMPVRTMSGRAPFRARLQSYGRVLDGLMLLTIAVALFEIAAVASL
jgi:hypothetical protein